MKSGVDLVKNVFKQEEEPSQVEEGEKNSSGSGRGKLRGRGGGRCSLYSCSAMHAESIGIGSHVYYVSTFRGGGKTIKTLGSQFSSQLQALMATLHKCNPHYIRCIKPNEKKEATLFTSNIVMRQLTYAGLFSAIQIRSSGIDANISTTSFQSEFCSVRVAPIITFFNFRLCVSNEAR